MSVLRSRRWGSLTGERRYYDDAVKQVLQFSRRMFNRGQGLFMHGWVQGWKVHPEFAGPRANGWALMTLVELLDVLPDDHPDRAAVVDLLRAHVAGWPRASPGRALAQLLDREDSYLETSATAIYAYAMAGRSIGAGSTRWRTAPRPYWRGTRSRRRSTRGQVEGTCVGNGHGFEPAFYYHRPTSPSPRTGTDRFSSPAPR